MPALYHNSPIFGGSKRNGIFDWFNLSLGFGFCVFNSSNSSYRVWKKSQRDRIRVENNPSKWSFVVFLC